MSPTAVGSSRSTIVKAALASLIGSSIEWYDFFAFGTAAALVFNKLFFTSLDPALATLSAMGTFSAGFIARPLGGVIAGHFGDRVGRKGMLILTLVSMGVATFLVGCLPTYAVVGAWAPVALILLRVFQGLAVGGEWGGAVLIAMEHAPENRRGFYASFAHLGVPIGGILSTGIFALATMYLPEQQFLSWGWRIPFLLSIVMVAIGLFIRLSIDESPDFTKAKAAGQTIKVPLAVVLRDRWRTILIMMGAKLSDNSTSYLMKVFVLVYAVKAYGISSSVMLNALMVAAVVQIVAIPGFAALSDRIGRKPVYQLGAALVFVLAFPTFWLMSTGDTLLVTVAISMMLGIAWSAMYGPQAALFSEIFNANIRYTGASLGYQLASVTGGGLSPVVAAALVVWSNGASWPVAVYMMGMAVVTIICVSYLGTIRVAPLLPVSATAAAS